MANVKMDEAYRMKSRELFDKAVAGDEQARDDFFRHHFHLIGMAVAKYTRKGMPFDEAASRANWSLYKAYGYFEAAPPDEEFTKYFWVTMSGRAMHYFRDRNLPKRRGLTSSLDIEPIDGTEMTLKDLVVDETAQDAFDAVTDNALLKAVMARYAEGASEEEQDILRLHFYEGLSQRKIAKIVGISQMNVCRIINRALKKLRSIAVALESA